MTRQMKVKTPKWNRALMIYRRGGLKDYLEYTQKYQLKAIRSDRCIVGEAWGFDAKYAVGLEPGQRCNTCYDFGIDIENTFDYDFQNEVIVPTKRTDSMKKKFEQHWDDVHSK